MTNTPAELPYSIPYSNPNKIVTAKKGAIFRRDGDKFTLLYKNEITELSLPKKTFLLHYRNDILKTLNIDDAAMSFEKERESWIFNGTDWTYLTDKEYSLVSTAQVVPQFFTNVSKETYNPGVSSSYTVSMIYTGSFYENEEFVVEISSSTTNWFYSGSRVITGGSLLLMPIYGDVSTNGAPWSFTFVSPVPTSSLLIIQADFMFNANANLTGSVIFHGDLSLSGSFKNYNKFTIYSGSI